MKHVFELLPWRYDSSFIELGCNERWCNVAFSLWI